MLHAQGNLAGARPLIEQALAIREKAFGPEHPDTAQSLNNLAALLQAQGDLADAWPLFERALTIRKKALGPDSPDTANSLANLAAMLHAQGNLAGARPLIEQALAIYQKALGPDHPDVAKSLNNLAMLIKTQGYFADARPLLERALKVCEAALGADHRLTSRIRCNLAGLWLAEGFPSEALTFAEAALAAHDRALGRDHPWTKELRPRHRRLPRRPRTGRRSCGGTGAVRARCRVGGLGWGVDVTTPSSRAAKRRGDPGVERPTFPWIASPGREPTTFTHLKSPRRPLPQLGGEDDAARRASDAVWPAGWTQVGLHDRHREPSSAHICFPHPTPRFVPPCPLRGEGETRQREQSHEEHRESTCVNRAGCDPGAAMTTPRSFARPALRAHNSRRA